MMDGVLPLLMPLPSTSYQPPCPLTCPCSKPRQERVRASNKCETNHLASFAPPTFLQPLPLRIVGVSCELTRRRLPVAPIPPSRRPFWVSASRAARRYDGGGFSGIVDCRPPCHPLDTRDPSPSSIPAWGWSTPLTLSRCFCFAAPLSTCHCSWGAGARFQSAPSIVNTFLASMAL